MHSTEQSTPRANLAAMLVREIRTGRRLRLHLRYAIEQRRALADALHVAVKTIGDLSRKLDRARQNAIDLREENRRYVRAKFIDGGPDPNLAADLTSTHRTEAVQ